MAKPERKLSWNHFTSTLHRSETNGTAEGAVRRIEEGTSAANVAIGVSEKWWAGSMECDCYLGNIQDVFSDVKHLSKGDLENHLRDPLISFGSMIECHSISSKDQSRLHLGESWDVHCMREECGKEFFWTQTWGSSKIWTRRKAVLGDSMRRKSSCRKNGENSFFPIADGTD